MSRHLVLVAIAVALEVILFVAFLASYPLPKSEAIQAAALLAFFASFL